MIGRRALALALGIFLALAGTASGAVKHEFQGSFDGSDSPQGFLLYTTAVAVDNSGGPSHGDVYVGHLDGGTFAGRVDMFDSPGTYAGLQIDGSATPQGSFGLVVFANEHTGSIAVDDSTANPGDLYVADIGNEVIHRFDEDGSFDCQITARPPASRSAAEAAAECNGPAGSETGFTSMEPTGIAVDPANGELYVADARNSVVAVFSPSGEYLEQIADSRFVGLTSLAVGPGSILYVASESGALKFKDGAFDSLLRSPARGVAVSPIGGNVLVLVSSNETDAPPTFVAEYTPDGEPVDNFGQAQEIPFTRELAVGPQGNVYLGENAFGPGNVYIYNILVVPNATTGDVIGIDATTATLTGEAEPDNVLGSGDVTSCHFEYVEETDYEPAAANPYAAGQSVPCEQPTPYSGPTEVSAEATGLTQGVRYHYRLLAGGAQGAGDGGDRVFVLDLPTIGGERSIARTTSATVQAQINPSSLETTCKVEYVERTAFEASGWDGGGIL